MSGPRERRGEPRDAGFTMVEMLVAMALFGVLGTVLIGFALGSSRVADHVTAAGNVTEEARLAIERMGRELRQASQVSGATVVDGKVVSLTLGVDFDGNGTVETNDALDPEVLTYRWDAAARTLTLTANDSVTRPVLAGGVQAVDIRLRSSAWIHDINGDGTTTWQEVDASSVGDGDGVPDGPELDLVDLVSVVLVVRDGDAVRRFTVQADLRNRGAVT